MDSKYTRIVSTISQIIIALASAACAVLIYLIWQRPVPQPPTWDVSEFEFTGAHHDDDFDKTKTYNAVLILSSSHFINGEIQIKQDGEEPAYGADQVLDRLGSDGWELAWSDGQRYIVKRPQGKWRHDFFEVEYQLDSNSTPRQIPSSKFE
jgi:hypothetical protein